MRPAVDKEAGRARLAELVAAFQRNEADYLRADYNETQTRTEFITPMLEAFGWDVNNQAGKPLAFREVIEEATVEVGDEGLSKRPDYELRLTRQRKLFVEAKKPSVAIENTAAPAFQTRRYGYSASLPISAVTNFYRIAIYDCKPVPLETDKPHVARLLLFRYDEFLPHFDELWDLISRETVYSGSFDRQFEVDSTRHGANQFDDYFLNQTRDWRERLAVDIHANSPTLTAEEITYAVQLFLSRIVFLRICEDREIEKYETLKNLSVDNTFDALMELLRRADDFYDSGLFRLLDDEKLGIRISDDVLGEIIGELYYPRSPYTFAVVETQVLGQIYEQFLGDVITMESGKVEIVNRPEVRESGGVVPTPGYIADSIATKTVMPLLAGKSPDELKDVTIADICCGSGIFLLAAYGILIDYYLTWYLEHNRDEHIGSKVYEISGGQWRLTFAEKRRVLVTHLRGVDIDSNAVEVTQLSLLLKLVEDESAVGLIDYVKQHKEAALPALDDNIKCGNSLVSAEEWREAFGNMSTELRRKVNPFSWNDEFANELQAGGFDAIVGNPPYIRIQNMVAYSPEEVAFYQDQNSPYCTAHQNNFDKYALFVERSISLVKDTGRVGVITPHKFMTIHSGATLRDLLSKDRLVEEIVHFGVKQVFGRSTATYTCILVLSKKANTEVRVEKAGPLEQWRYGKSGDIVKIPSIELSDVPWAFADQEARALFTRISKTHPATLSSVAEILVGLQTSADKVYIVNPILADDQTVTIRWNRQDWKIEQSILRPFLHDVSLTAYARAVANTSIIFPYEYVTNNNGKLRARLFQPDEMQRTYPECWKYLLARKPELESRNVTGGPEGERQWYQYGRSQSLTKFDRPKIILPVLSTEARYCYDDQNILFTGGGNGPYYMIRCKDESEVSDKYLLAVLNHPLCEAIIRTNTSPFRGGYYSHGKQFIENLPVPLPDAARRQEIEERVTKLIGVLRAQVVAKTPHEARLANREATDVRRDIETRIGEAFGLTAADLAIISAVPIPT